MDMLVIEAQVPDGWVILGKLAPGMQPGSISDNSGARREVFLSGKPR
jgi:hypothetical protein